MDMCTSKDTGLIFYVVTIKQRVDTLCGNKTVPVDMCTSKYTGLILYVVKEIVPVDMCTSTDSGLILEIVPVHQ